MKSILFPVPFLSLNKQEKVTGTLARKRLVTPLIYVTILTNFCLKVKAMPFLVQGQPRRHVVLYYALIFFVGLAFFLPAFTHRFRTDFLQNLKKLSPFTGKTHLVIKRNYVYRDHSSQPRPHFNFPNPEPCSSGSFCLPVQCMPG